jgi:8-amino-7-oxononanoate synthase
MNNLDQELKQRLETLRESGLYRQIRGLYSPQSPRIQVGGRTVLNFSSNDYLGFANDPALKSAAAEAAAHFGAGAGASRLICGTLRPHEELEQALADFKGTEAALTFSSGYAAAMGTIGALLRSTDVIILDRLVHACIVDAARLCGAKMRVFDHNDPIDLERILRWAQTRRCEPGSQRHGTHALIVTESVFSMDGDRAPLPEIVRLKEQYGAWLMVDEAHSTGLFGPNGGGLAEEFQISNQVEIHMGTLGKALGASGGFICGSRILIDYLINRARSFVFSTAPVPAAAAAATAGIRLVQSEAGPKRRAALWARVADFNMKANNSNSRSASSIIPILIGDEAEAARISAKLLDLGVFIPAIRYPTVARGKARLRVTLTAIHTPGDVALLIEALRSVNQPRARILS